jgi:hypothetical protein
MSPLTQPDSSAALRAEQERMKALLDGLQATLGDTNRSSMTFDRLPTKVPPSAWP